MLNFFISNIIKNVKVKVTVNIKKLLKFKKMEYKSSRKVLKALKSPSGGP